MIQGIGWRFNLCFFTKLRDFSIKVAIITSCNGITKPTKDKNILTFKLFIYTNVVLVFYLIQNYSFVYLSLSPRNWWLNMSLCYRLVSMDYIFSRPTSFLQKSSCRVSSEKNILNSSVGDPLFCPLHF